MKIDNQLLLDCVIQVCDYNFSRLQAYQIIGDSIFVTVESTDTMKEYWVGSKTVEIYMDEYLLFSRSKKMNKMFKNC